MFSPYFQSEHYKNESTGAKFEKKIESFLKKIFFWKKKTT